MAGNPVETFQRRVGTPSGLQLTLDATVVASGPDTQVCAGSTVLPAVETADDRQSVSQGRWRCPWLLVPRYGNFSRRRGPRAPPMVATASRGSPRGGWQPSGATVVTQPWGADAVSPCGPAALPTACETSYPPPSNSAALAQRRYRSGRSTGARPRSRGQARAAWRSRPRLTAWSPPAPGARADRRSRAGRSQALLGEAAF